MSIVRQLAYGMPLYNLLFVSLILFFAYFYTAIIFNPDDVSENMRKYGGFIPGIRPGKRTAEHIDTILTRITLAGAAYLCLVALLPEFMITGFKVAPIPFIGERLDAILPQWFTNGLGVNFFFGGTSLLIVVGVAMDTVAAAGVAAHHAALRRLHRSRPEDSWSPLMRSRSALSVSSSLGLRALEKEPSRRSSPERRAWLASPPGKC
jgi:preprotein translocase subunit SecY